MLVSKPDTHFSAPLAAMCSTLLSRLLPFIPPKPTTRQQAINLTTNSFQFVLQGQLPSGDALLGLTGLKTLDIRQHHITGVCVCVCGLRAVLKIGRALHVKLLSTPCKPPCC